MKAKIAMLGLALAILCAGCEKDKTTVLKAKISGFDKGSKVYIDNTRTPRWHSGDKVKVNGTETTVSVSGNNGSMEVAAAGVYKAVYPSAYVTGMGNQKAVYLNIPRSQTYEDDGNGRQIVRAPMGAYSENETLLFKNLGSLLGIIVNNDRSNGTIIIDSISVKSSNVAMHGAATISDITADEPTYHFNSTYHADNNDSVVLTSIDYALDEDEEAKFYVCIPGITDNNKFTIRVFIHYEDNEDDTYVYSRSQTTNYAGSIPAGNLANVPFTLSSASESIIYGMGRINGLFSVSAVLQVYFSKGNLQYQASTNTFKFAEHQYDYIGNNPGNTTAGTFASTTNPNATNTLRATQEAWIDLFCYGTSGYSQKPYACINQSAYETLYNGNLYSNTNYDWGMYNPILNGGNTTGMWRTLSTTEFKYLLNTRSASTINGVANVRYIWAKVNNHNGIILFPDVFSWPDGISLPSGNNSTISDPSTLKNHVYTAEQFKKLQKAGCVFIPLAGGIDGIASNQLTPVVRDTEINGLYYLSDKNFVQIRYDSSNDDDPDYSFIYFSSDNRDLDLSDKITSNRGVRLVQDYSL